MAKFKNQCSSGSKASRYILLLNVTTGTQNISGNYTPVSYTLQLAGGNYDGDNYNQYASSFHGYTCYGSVQVRNANTGALLHESGSSSNGMVSNTSAITIASGSFNAPHNDDGTLLLGFEGVFTGGLSSQTNGGSISGDVLLPVIARASGITATDSLIESTTSIIIDKKSTNFTTTITYVFGDLSGTIATKTSNTSIGWNIPESFYEQIPNTSSGICNLTATTYNGDTLIGSTTTTFRATINPDKTRPLATITAIDVNEKTKSLTDGIGKTVVIGQSRIKCDITKQARKGATITSVRVNGIEIGNAESVIIEKPNLDFFSVVVTDSRGFTNENATETLKKVPYIDVSIKADVVRNTPTDGKVNILFSGNYFNKSFGNVANTLDVQYKYKEKNAEEYSTPQSLTFTLNDDNTYSGEVKEIEGFDYEKEYIFQVIATDRLTFAPKSPIEIMVSKGKPVYWWDEKNFYVDGDYYIRNKTTDEWEKLFDLIYPVGSIYMSINSTNPSLLFGGEWQQIKGRFLLGTGTPDANSDNYFGGLSGRTWNAGAGSTGGEDFHTLTAAEMPSHRHNGLFYSGNGKSLNMNSSNNNAGYNLTWGQTGSGVASEIYTGNTGGNAAFAKMPPYFAVYMWKRTA